MKEELKKKLLKLYELSKRGEGGEKVNAEMFLNKLLAKHNLTVDQMAGYAEMFVKNNPTLKIDEIILILKKGMNGEYGKHNGFFDYQVLTDWRSAYENGARAEYFEGKNHNSEIGSSLRRSAHGESFGQIAKDSVAKINESKNDGIKSKNDALEDYRKKFKK